MGLKEGIAGRKMLDSFRPCITRPFLLMFGKCKFTKMDKKIYPICDFITLETFVHRSYDSYNGKKNVVVGYNHHFKT